MKLILLPLGQPDRFNVDAAARLYLEYDKAGLLSDEVCEVFAMSVNDYDAVYRRAHEILATEERVIDDTNFFRHSAEIGFRRRAWEWFMKREQAY